MWWCKFRVRLRALLAAVCAALVGASVLLGVQPAEKSSIDAILERAWSAAGVEPAPLCSDELFLRRITLDLLGRIPTLQEQREFLAHRNREQAITRLLESEEWVQFCAELFTTQLYGHDLANSSDQRALLAEWLADQLRSRRPYDQMVIELLTASGESALSGPVNFLLRHPDEPIVKVSRVFLGIRLECARCHDHPFDRWTQQDFVGMSRFFGTVERQEIAPGNVRLMEVVRAVDPQEKPRFLSGAVPRTSQWRAEFALFLTRSRPFARNFANRLWYHFLGRGIVHPVDDVRRDNPPAVPELLEYLAEEARQSRFDLRHMMRLICCSRAYQLESRVAPLNVRAEHTINGPARSDVRSADHERRVKLFAVRAIKPLLPWQLYAAACTANEMEPDPDERRAWISAYYGSGLEEDDFSSTWEYRETVHGLMSRLVARLPVPSGSTEELFLRYLGRRPQPHEMRLVAGCSPSEIGYLLLHSSEFAFNY